MPNPLISSHADPTSRRILWLGASVFTLLWAACTLLGDGFFEADSCTHYLYARFALSEPHYLVNVWGRPLCTALYALPAALAGLIGARTMSLALALLCGQIAYLIARDHKLRHPALAALFTWGMPLVFFHSLDVMTELPFAAMLGLAFLAWQRQHWFWLALTAGLLPLGRPEGFGFILLAALVLIIRKKWHWLVILAAPLILWNIAGWSLFGRQTPIWRWLIDNWPYAENSLYGHGALLRFAALLPTLVSPLIFPMTIMGAVLCLRRSPREPSYSHLDSTRKWIALLPLGVLVIHSLLYWTGKLASNGELRYLLILAPLWGVLSAIGWQWFSEKLHWRQPIALAAMAIVIPGATNFFWRTLPPVMKDDWLIARSISTGYAHWNQRPHYPRLIASHPAIYYFLDLSPNDPQHTHLFDRATIQACPAGTLFIWDDIYGLFNATADRSISLSTIQSAGWIELAPSQLGLPSISPHWRIFHSPDPLLSAGTP